MYAVIKTGGKQHKVAEGEILKVEKLKAEAVLKAKKIAATKSRKKTTTSKPKPTRRKAPPKKPKSSE